MYLVKRGVEMVNILVLEDDLDIRTVITEYLTKNSFKTFAAKTANEAMHIINNDKIDLFITDVMLPQKDGFSFTKELRSSNYNFPILMITAKESIQDKEKGFVSGADDYMVKPLILRELLLRVNALLRRTSVMNEKKLIIKNIVLDKEEYSLLVDNKIIDVTKKEFELLFKFLSNPNKIFTKEVLMDDIWGYNSNSYDTTIKVHISKIRDKVKSEYFEIVAVKGLGYKGVLK